MKTEVKAEHIHKTTYSYDFESDAGRDLRAHMYAEETVNEHACIGITDTYANSYFNVRLGRLPILIKFLQEIQAELAKRVESKP